MNQKLSPDAYAALALPDQWIEDVMQEVEARWIVEKLHGYETVLELGYGAGIITRALVNAGKEVTTLDGSSEFVGKAQGDGAKAIHTMFEAFTTEAKFDCVIASFVIEHVADPVSLLKRCREWSDTLIVVVGNANSYHRQLAVKMGLQPNLDSLSARDELVGHYRVYDWDTIGVELAKAGWAPRYAKGFQFKPLPNSMMSHFDERLIRAMCELEVSPTLAANIGFVCR